MKNRYRLFRRKGIFYCHDGETGKQESLQTKDRGEATRLLHAKNESTLQPNLNFQIAQVYLTASDPAMLTRTWLNVMEAITATKTGPTLERWATAIKDKAFDLIRNWTLIETRGEHLHTVLNAGTVSTNVYLRRIHNFALDMKWLPTSLIVRRVWPKVHYKKKRAIRLDEHMRIVSSERDPERRAFYELAWFLGASQSDLAHLHAEDVGWKNRIISFERMKTRWRDGEPPQICFGLEVERILRSLPESGPLFPYLINLRESDRANLFRDRCMALGITGVTLHSYRYAWAQRAYECGYPERFAQKALGHNSKAVHRAYARGAHVIMPDLEKFQKDFTELKIIPIQLQTTVPSANQISQQATKRP